VLWRGLSRLISWTVRRSLSKEFMHSLGKQVLS
jgi:hypothetical protein